MITSDLYSLLQFPYIFLNNQLVEYAKVISMAKVTTDHKEIKQWAEKHGGTPELIDHKDAQHDQVGIRINFPGVQDDVFHSDANPPRKITWEDFFKIFDEHGLGFEYDDDEKALNFEYRFTNR